jgi:hypothetical protein
MPDDTRAETPETATETPLETPLETPSTQMAAVVPQAPPELLALPYIADHKHGRLIANQDVAKAFETDAEGLRTWRNRGRFPKTVGRRGNVTYYALASLLGPWRERHPQLPTLRPGGVAGVPTADVADASPTLSQADSMRELGRAMGQPIAEEMRSWRDHDTSRMEDLIRENERLRLRVEQLEKALQDRELTWHERLTGRLDAV